MYISEKIAIKLIELLFCIIVVTILAGLFITF